MTFDPYTMEFEIANSESPRFTLPWQFRERHLTEECEGGDALVQPCGDEIRICVFSERDDLMLRFPLKEWYAEQPRKRSLRSWRIDLSRYAHLIDWDSVDDDWRVGTAQISPIDIEAADEDRGTPGQTQPQS